jgi:dTDP-glucose 4,6-dehydratase
MRILVTGGAGFIGSALVRHLIRNSGHEILNFDKLTYAGVLESLDEVAADPRYRFVRGDICDASMVARLLADFQPDVVAHLAAESHVDRSIDAPGGFIQTNIVGTYTMVEQSLSYWRGIEPERQQGFRFHHISTDEVFGSLGDEGHFTEATPYDPRSPYSASKAASDHIVRAWSHTFGLPVLVTNCSNNYGPFHFPEKLVPLVIIRALREEDLPVYGDGSNVRDWLFVEDHARALTRVFEQGRPGETYNVGGNSERQNIDVVRTICAALDVRKPRPNGRPYADLIRFVTDRPGHDQRYSIDATKITRELGWAPEVSFEEGIRRTVDWYLQRSDWWEPILARRYDTGRLGLKPAATQ